MTLDSTLPLNESVRMLPRPTFRDPSGSLSFHEDGILRRIRPEARIAVLDFLHSPLCRRLQQSGLLIDAEIDDLPTGLTLRHPRVSIPTYPWEWTPSQWLAAAELTLDLAQQALAEGWILKDATPLNILFLDAKPIFVDILSFERHNQSPIWLAYGQYMRTFLLPLVMNRLSGWPLTLSLLNRDGFDPATLYAHLTWRQRLSRDAFWPITLPALLEGRSRNATPAAARPTQPDPDFAVHQLSRTFRNLLRRTQRAVPAAANSNWSQYQTARAHYTPAQTSQKTSFIEQTLDQFCPARVLDIGANTGEYSILAANAGARVTALERDAAAANRLFTRTRGLAIQTIVADLARPTPAAGWDNSESLALIPRLEGQFDLVLMLAVIHHLILADQIPIPAIVELIARLTRAHLIIEWVPATDPMFQSMMLGRETLYAYLTQENLLAACRPHFHLLKSQALDNGRILYLFNKRTPAEPC